MSLGTLIPNLNIGPVLFLTKHTCLQYQKRFLRFLLAHFLFGWSQRFFFLPYWATIARSSAFVTSQGFSLVFHNTSSSIVGSPSNLAHRQCLGCSHELVLQVHTRSCINDITLDIPIGVGTPSSVSMRVNASPLNVVLTANHAPETTNNLVTPMPTSSPKDWDASTAAITASVVVSNPKIFMGRTFNQSSGINQNKKKLNLENSDIDSHVKNIKLQQQLFTWSSGKAPTLAHLLDEMEVSVNIFFLSEKQDKRWCVET